MRKKFKPIVFLIPENTDDIFVDIEYLQEWRKECPFNEYYYESIRQCFGKNVFVFDVGACEFTKGE